MEFGGYKETMPKAFRVGPLFPPENTRAAKKAAAAKRKEKEVEICYDELRKAGSFQAAVKLIRKEKKKK